MIWIREGRATGKLIMKEKEKRYICMFICYEDINYSQYNKTWKHNLLDKRIRRKCTSLTMDMFLAKRPHKKIATTSKIQQTKIVKDKT